MQSNAALPRQSTQFLLRLRSERSPSQRASSALQGQVRVWLRLCDYKFPNFERTTPVGLPSMTFTGDAWMPSPHPLRVALKRGRPQDNSHHLYAFELFTGHTAARGCCVADRKEARVVQSTDHRSTIPVLPNELRQGDIDAAVNDSGKHAVERLVESSDDAVHELSGARIRYLRSVGRQRLAGSEGPGDVAADPAPAEKSSGCCPGKEAPRPHDDGRSVAAS